MAGLLLKNVMHKKILDYHTGGKILDIGCNNGLFLHILKNIGWDVSGVEVNAQAAKAANSLGLNCFCGYLADAKYPDHTFDVVRVYHVLEHVYSPWELLVEIKRILKPRGCVYLEIPNQRSFSFFILKHVWHGREGHLYAFSPATFQKLCDKAGFRVEKSSVQSSVAKFCADLKIWSQYKGGWANAIYPKLVSNKMLKTMLIKPFFAIIDLIGLGDKYAVQLGLEP